MSFNYTLEKLYRLAMNNQQELNALDFDIEKYGKKIKLAKMDYLPNFKIGFDYIQVGDAEKNLMGNVPDDNGQDAYGVNFGISIPLWFGKNNARLRQAKLERQAAIYEKKDLENKTVSQIKLIYFKLQNSDRLVKLYKESLIPQAVQSMQAAEVWYKQKQGSFSGLLEAQSIWLNFNLAQHRALTDYYQRIAQLEGLVGVNLMFDKDNLIQKGAN